MTAFLDEVNESLVRNGLDDALAPDYPNLSKIGASIDDSALNQHRSGRLLVVHTERSDAASVAVSLPIGVLATIRPDLIDVTSRSENHVNARVQRRDVAEVCVLAVEFKSVMLKADFGYSRSWIALLDHIVRYLNPDVPERVLAFLRFDGSS